MEIDLFSLLSGMGAGGPDDGFEPIRFGTHTRSGRRELSASEWLAVNVLATALTRAIDGDTEDDPLVDIYLAGAKAMNDQDLGGVMAAVTNAYDFKNAEYGLPGAPDFGDGLHGEVAIIFGLSELLRAGRHNVERRSPETIPTGGDK